ncbi:CRISPR-associated protein, Csx14 family [Archaeoglobus fulgidus DSM 8774]|uniref:CRISPR-associated protein, Csx14 family n=1 Tax=Archaeoglobus fulgidus DSM 8774 TaxID=1344584 RepID=A0A075WE65_ARCFL|nr:CRISPR-associated protein Csx14 [Archaeoglobus fulgidus]AIG97434.1 CRISPR-associated protein, Csx14 family [Archaeoglobus fulgidus DSM 8774]
MSPPVITAFVKAFEDIKDVVVLTTDNTAVKQGFELVRVALKVNYPNVRVHEKKLPLEDVTTTDENFQFMGIAAKIVKEQREKYGSRRIYLNVSGGRKNMGITLSLLGQLMGVDGVFHVITGDVRVVNVQLENLRKDIERIYKAKSEEEKIEIYKERERYFNSLMFPDAEIVRIPTIPFPQYYVERIVKALYTKEIDELTESERNMLAAHGLLEKVGRRFEVTEFGEKLAHVLLTGKPG